jgi:predicted nucleic acid-binding protein
MTRSYEMAGLHKISVYDAVFVSLALELGLALRTFDRLQAKVFKSEGGRT